jgi:uncharacterized metal-binding protein
VITLRKWYPFVHPGPHDIRELASEKRAERLEEEYKQGVKALKMRTAVQELEVELYSKRARQNTIELGSFSNRTRFDKLV